MFEALHQFFVFDTYNHADAMRWMDDGIIDSVLFHVSSFGENRDGLTV